jgi:hypothetical protein
LYVEYPGCEDGEENIGMITLCLRLLAQVKGIMGVEDTQSEPTAFEISDPDAVIARRLRTFCYCRIYHIVPSLTEYLTNIKRAGRLYIIPSEYHTK